MPAKRLENVSWYVDQGAVARGEPGIRFSYMAALAGALQSAGRPVDPAWLMGASAWAFRIIVNEILCPSAMSIFDWTGTLPVAVEQAGYHCTYISRLWHEAGKEAERREEAHREIVRGIDTGMPAVVWDIALPEWGLITGYDEGARAYDTLSCMGQAGTMPYEELGSREIQILSVAVPGESNGRPQQEIIRRSLAAAVRHAEQGEWMERPQYQDGLPAYDLWARIMRPDYSNPEDRPVGFEYGEYYAAHYYGARCYARDYLRMIADGDAALGRAAEAYGRVAESLRPVWEQFRQNPRPDDLTRLELADCLYQARAAEAEGIAQLKAHLARS